MQNNYKYLIVLFFLLFTLFTNAQKSTSANKKDTLFVYETVTIYDTVFVYDTVWVLDNIKTDALESKSAVLNMLQCDTANKRANLLFVSNNHAATIPINGIILSDNIKNLESMKKLSFFGVVLFAFQSMIMSQTDFGISAGGGTWWAKCNEPIGNVEFSPAFNAGMFLEYPLVSNVFLKTELNYTFLMNNYSYKAVVDTINWVLVGEAESASDYHQIAIPLQVGYKFGKFKPFLGLEYSYRISESWLNNSMSSFALTGGINYVVSDKLSLGLSYYSGLTKDYEYSGTIINPITTERVGEYDDYWRSSRLGLTLYYTFKNNKVKE